MGDLPQENFSIMNYLKIFFRRKELFIIPAFLGLIAGICTGIVMPKQFKSSTVILVEEGKSDNPLFTNLAVSTTVRQRLATIREAMLGWNSLVKLVKRLNLDKSIKTTRQFESLINKIRDNIEIRLRGHNVLSLSYVGEDPVETQAVVKNITDIFIERNKRIQNQETSDAIRFIEEQLRVYKGKIKSAEIAKLQDQLNDLLMDSTEKHPVVRELREKIDQKKEELRQENLEYTEVGELEQENNNPLIESIKSAIDSIEPSTESSGPREPEENIYRVMLLDKLETVLARDVKVNARIYNMLLQRLETAKITQRLQASKEGTRYSIIEPPRIPHEPFKPDRVLLSLLGLFGGGVLGLGLVFATEFLDKSFIDVEEAKEFLGVPLLGAISKIATEDTLRQERDHQRWVYTLTFFAGIAIVIVTLTVANYLNL